VDFILVKNRRVIAVEQFRKYSFLSGMLAALGTFAPKIKF